MEQGIRGHAEREFLHKCRAAQRKIGKHVGSVWACGCSSPARARILGVVAFLSGGAAEADQRAAGGSNGGMRGGSVEWLARLEPTLSGSDQRPTNGGAPLG